VAEQKIDGKLLLETAGIYEKAFRKSSVPMGITDSNDGHFIDVSNAFLELTGLERDELLKKTSLEIGIISTEKRSLVLNELHMKGNVKNFEIQVINKSGVCRDGLLNINKITQGQEEYLVTVFTDISERRHADELLKQSEEKYRAITEKMNDVAWTTDLDLKFTYLSSSIKKLTGYTPEEYMKTTPGDVFPAETLTDFFKFLNDEYQIDDTGKSVETGKSKSFEFVTYHKDGYKIWVECVVSVIREGNGKMIGLHGVSRDISERKRTALEKERLIAKLNQALSEVKTLSGLLPICSYCKKIRDDNGYWKQIESYITSHSDLFFSHGICPECLKKHHSELNE
jgi:PAS domain S-box-containing protein